MDETRDHCLELIAPVVAPGEAGEIASGMVGAELAISPGDRALDVAERRVHPFERCHAGRLSARPGADRLMAAGGFFECAPAAQAVRHNRRSGGQPVLGAARDLALAEALDRRQIQLARAPLGTGRDRRHTEGRFARRAAAPLAAGAHPAEIGVVHLDPPRKRRLPLAPRHHRHDLVLHGPGRRLLDPETAAEFHRRDAVLRRHDQVDGGKPECQRQLGRMKDRARRGRCLLLAPVALIETPTRQHAMLPMAAAGADEAARPAQPDQRRAALLLRTEGLPQDGWIAPDHLHLVGATWNRQILGAVIHPEHIENIHPRAAPAAVDAIQPGKPHGDRLQGGDQRFIALADMPADTLGVPMLDGGEDPAPARRSTVNYPLTPSVPHSESSGHRVMIKHRHGDCRHWRAGSDGARQIVLAHQAEHPLAGNPLCRLTDPKPSVTTLR